MGTTPQHEKVSPDLRRAAVRSAYADDPEFNELLAMFVAEVPALGRRLEDSFREHELGRLNEQAHQLKGAGGGYGFAELSSRAAALESACKASNPERVAESLAELLDLLGRIAI